MKFLLICFLSSAFFASNSYGKIKLVTTITDLAWVASEIGGDKVEANSLLDGTENPHYVDAVPSYISALASADIVCFVGLGLEIGWLPKILSRTGNSKVQLGGQGHCDLGKGIKVLEKPKGKVDRSMGDVHPDGNPHFWLSPERLIQAGQVILESLIVNDPINAQYFSERFDHLKKNLTSLHKDLQLQLKNATTGKGGVKFIQYHQDFTYFFDSYGLNSIGSIESKPGVVPSAGQIARSALNAKKQGVKIALALEYNPKNTLKKFAEISGAQVLYLPGSIQKGTKLDDYKKLQTFYITQILNGLK